MVSFARRSEEVRPHLNLGYLTPTWLDKQTQRPVRQRARALRYVGLRARCSTRSARSTSSKEAVSS
jgi:hypothetical protein